MRFCYEVSSERISCETANTIIKQCYVTIGGFDSYVVTGPSRQKLECHRAQSSLLPKESSVARCYHRACRITLMPGNGLLRSVADGIEQRG